jgi:plastocyanin
MTGKSTTRRVVSILATTVLAAVVAGAASAHGTPSSLVIEHQLRGCHAWALNGGALKAAQTITVKAGSTIDVTNDDVMPHLLVQTGGPAVTLRTVRMSHMGALARITFAHKGVYTFTTKAGEDYMKGVKTVGPDNVLRLKVTVA